MLTAAELINFAWCETEDGFPGPLGGFSSLEPFQCRPLPPPHVTKPMLGYVIMCMYLGHEVLSARRQIRSE